MEDDTISCGTTSSTKSSRNEEPLTPPPEHARPCPLCSSEIKMFFVATNTVTLMCVNSECEYPFGYEDLELLKLGDLNSSSFDSGSTMTLSSDTAWSEIDKCSSVHDPDDSDFEGMNDKNDKQKKGEDEPEPKKSKTEKNFNIKKNVNDIKELSKMLYTMKNGEATITDKKFALNLYKLQGKTGNSFLKPAELQILKKQKLLQQSSVTINIEQDPSRISTITIDLPATNERENI